MGRWGGLHVAIGLYLIALCKSNSQITHTHAKKKNQNKKSATQSECATFKGHLCSAASTHLSAQPQPSRNNHSQTFSRVYQQQELSYPHIQLQIRTSSGTRSGISSGTSSETSSSVQVHDQLLTSSGRHHWLWNNRHISGLFHWPHQQRPWTNSSPPIGRQPAGLSSRMARRSTKTWSASLFNMSTLEIITTFVSSARAFTLFFLRC